MRGQSRWLFCAHPRRWVLLLLLFEWWLVCYIGVCPVGAVIKYSLEGNVKWGIALVMFACFLIPNKFGKLSGDIVIATSFTLLESLILRLLPLLTLLPLLLCYSLCYRAVCSVASVAALAASSED